MADRKKQTLLTGAGVLAIASLSVKLIGALYKIPLTDYILTVEGYAFFTRAYAVYSPLYAISMAGLPVAVSKLVSQNVELGRIRDAQRIFTVARKLFLIVGLVGTAILCAIAVPYSHIIGRPMNYVAILVVAPCILFCCQMSSFRGYYEGLTNMTPTAVSQVIEALSKLVFGLGITYFFFKKWVGSYHANNVDGVATVFGVQVENEAQALAAIYPFAAAVAISGVTLGSMLGLVYLYARYKKKGFGFTRDEIVNSPAPESDKTLRSQIIRIAAPVALSSIVLNISNIIDDFTINIRLDHAFEVGKDIIKGMYSQIFTAAGTLDEGIVDYLYGTHASVINIKNLIPQLTLVLGISAIPILSMAWTAKDKTRIKSNIETVIRVTMMVALPAGMGIAVLADPILRLLYSKQTAMIPLAAPMLRFYGFGIFLFAIVSPVTNMLQAIGRTDIPLRTVAIGSAIKIILNFILIGNPKININGAPISTTIVYALMITINLTSLIKVAKIKINFVSVFLKPLVAALACGATAFGSYKLLAEIMSINSKISTLAAICVGAGFYAIVLLLIKGIAKDDVLMLPKGEKIAKVLAKFRLLG